MIADREIHHTFIFEMEEFLQKGLRFVFFGIKTCKYCKKLTPDWLKLQKLAQYSPDLRNVDFEMTKIDCAEDLGYCADMGAKGFPTLIL